MADIVDLFTEGHASPHHLQPEAPPSYGDGDGTGGEQVNIAERLSKLEGQMKGLQWGFGIVSAALAGGMALLIGSMAVVVTMVMGLGSDIDGVSQRVNSLPTEINSNLMELTSTLSAGITATRGSEPSVIVIERAIGSAGTEELDSPRQSLPENR